MNACRFELPVHTFGRDTFAPWPWSTSTEAPALVACPIGAAEATAGAEALRELYRMAYEQAVASLRPSRYAHASNAGRN